MMRYCSPRGRRVSTEEPMYSLLKEIYPYPVYLFDEIPSTNAEALRLAKLGAPHGALVAAERQSAGRGRMGRRFFSPEGGLYMSLVLDTEPDRAGEITTLAAVAVARAAREMANRELQIKWVNDLMLDGRKVCGILAEGAAAKGGFRAALGIGVNLWGARFPGELAEKAGILLDEKPARDFNARFAARTAMLVIEGLAKSPGHMAEYRARCLTVGREVRAELNGREVFGLAVDVEDNGALAVQTGEGVVLVSAGEARVRAANGEYV